APRWAGGRPRRISERGHAEGEPTRANRRTYRRRLVLRSLRSGPLPLQRVRPTPPDPHARPRRKTTLRGVSADDGCDPLERAVDMITAADAALSTDVAAAAVRKAAPRSGHRLRLAWALQDRPELLTGAGADAPTRSCCG